MALSWSEVHHRGGSSLAWVILMPSIFCDLPLGRDRSAKYLGHRKWIDNTVGDCLQTDKELPICGCWRILWTKRSLVALPLLLPPSVINTCLQIRRYYLLWAGVMRSSRPWVVHPDVYHYQGQLSNAVKWRACQDIHVHWICVTNE